MTYDEYLQTQAGRGVPPPVVPVTAQPVARPTAPVENRNDDDLDELFEVPQPEDNDMAVDHLLAIGDENSMDDLTAVDEEESMEDLFSVEVETADPEEDLSDVIEVTDEDVMGSRPPAPVRTVVRQRPPVRRPIVPTGIGGVRRY